MINKKHIILGFLTICLIATIFMGTTTSQQPLEYNPWYDLTQDGIINIFDVRRVAKYYLLEGTPINTTALVSRMMTNNFQCGLLLPLPCGATGRPPDFGSSPTNILHSLDLNQTEPGDQQSIFVYKNTTITVSGKFQIFQSHGGSGAILQAFFIYSWTPSWPPPNSTYYYPLYDGAAGPYPGTGKQPFSFQLTVPNEIGYYYLYYCTGAEYNMVDAVNFYTEPLWSPFAVIIVGV